MEKEIFTDEFLKENRPKWFMKRRSTFWVYIFLYFVSGSENGFKNATLWIYVNQVMKLDNPYFYFGLIHSCMYISSLCVNPFISALADRVRKPKYFILIINAICFTGNFIYLIPYSPVYPAIGMFLFGCKYVSRPIMTGEIVRSFSNEQIVYTLPMVYNALSFGSAVALVYLLPFERVHFHFFGIPISYGNITGILGMTLYFIAEVLTILFVHNLSEEYDLKAHQYSYNSTTKQKERNQSGKIFTWKEIFRSTLTDIDLLLVFATVILYSFIEITTVLLLPTMVLSRLKLSVSYLNAGFFISTFILALMFIVIIKAKITSLHAYLIVFWSFSSMALLDGMYLISGLALPHTDKVMVVIISFFCFAVFVLIDDLYLSTVTAKLVRSEIQSTIEASRSQLRHLICLIAGLTVHLVYRHIKVYIFVQVVVSWLLLLAMVVRRKRLANPTPR